VFHSSGLSTTEGNIPESPSRGILGSIPSIIAVSPGKIDEGEEDVKLEASVMWTVLAGHESEGRRASSRMASQELGMEETSRLQSKPSALGCFGFRVPA
jgi:hypothetical protein